MMDCFIKCWEGLSGAVPKLEEVTCLAESPTNEQFMNVYKSSECMDLIDKYIKFKEEIRNGKLGKTATFWLKYTDCMWILIGFQRSVKEKSWDLYVHSFMSTYHLVVQFRSSELCQMFTDLPPIAFAYSHITPRS